MSSFHEGCRCRTESYDECLCRFCWTCGNMGHTSRYCRGQSNRSFAHCRSRSQELTTKTGKLEEAEEAEQERVEESEEEEGTAYDLKNSFRTCAIKATEVTRPGNAFQSEEHSPREESSRYLKRRNKWNEVAGSEIQTLNTGSVNRASILRHMLSKVHWDMRDRYGPLLENCDMGSWLEESLSPAVRQICERGKFDLASILEIGDDPTCKKEAGIYLHILWREDTTSTRFWLYVGQAGILHFRIEKHNDPEHRYKNMGLHYAVWGSHPGMKSAFMTLATITAPLCPKTQLVLNLAEMWMCLIFQTLTSLHLTSWLPENANPMWSGNHLNVALPLWQGFTDTQGNQAVTEAIGGRLTFQQYLASRDPIIRKWAEHARDAFNDIRNSPDPAIRKYWWDLHEERISKSQQTQSAKRSKVAREYLGGVTVPVKVYPGNHGDHQTEIRAGDFKFTISQQFGLNLKDGNEVVLKYHLLPTTHPYPYAALSLPTDPASRLGVSIQGHDGLENFHCWLITLGECNVKKMNTLVDILEGYSLEDNRGFQRRWFVSKAFDRKKGRVFYT